MLHADHLRLAAAGFDIDPIVFGQREEHVALGEQLEVVVKLPRRKGDCSVFGNGGRAGGPQTAIQVGSSDVQRSTVSLEKDVGKDGMVVLRSVAD